MWLLDAVQSRQGMHLFIAGNLNASGAVTEISWWAGSPC